ncbi:hypothetical protein [Actinoplanes sp. NPDC051494]|uniref:hypothetical protein n=1 Tax=Actinoplanes sp. NPDC051494 TaxID=3363907 RepID=UPI0037A22F1C
MDLTLAILLAGATVYAGGVAYVRSAQARGACGALTVAAGAALGVGTSLVLMVALAQVSTLAGLAAVALFAAAGIYLTFARDLGRRQAAWSAAAAAVVITICFLLVSYLAVLSLIGATGVYLVLRGRLRVGQALLAMGTTFGGLIAAAAAVFFISLTFM